MAGLYLHIPFCRSRCVYCGFFSTTQESLRQHYVDALCREMEIRQDEPSPITTIYLGGGTPSQLPPKQLSQLFLYISKVYDLTPLEEVTMECNPDDITPEYAAALSQFPVNRVSMGAQTFDDKRLCFLHRRHSAAQVAQAVQILRHAGIRNISIDLMYGFPNETLDEWRRDIDSALALNVEHLSAYCLSYEEGTPLYRMLQDGKVSETDEETERAMYYELIDRLEANGFEHYEISNFARPGFHSRHNSSYWTDVPYIGLGAAAHSYDRKRRQWNVADIKEYILAVGRGILPYDYEEIDETTRYNERIMLGLRTSRGVDLTTLSAAQRRYCEQEAQRFLANGLLCCHDDRLLLTRNGLFVSDMVMSALMMA